MTGVGELRAPTHPLDRPAWSALTTCQHRFGLHAEHAVRLDPEVGVFVAGRDDTPSSLSAVDAFVRRYPGSGLLEAAAFPREAFLPAGAEIDFELSLLQMTCEALAGANGSEPRLPVVDLDRSHAAMMLDLATLTRPGPFVSRTHELGDFIGVLEAGALIAMAGQRLRVDGFIEISGVCTLPDYRGRGLARMLIRLQVDRILAAGAVPFLHAVESNEGAISLYRSLGFEPRQRLSYIVMK